MNRELVCIRDQNALFVELHMVSEAMVLPLAEGHEINGKSRVNTEGI